MKKIMFSALTLGALMFTASSCTKTCDAGYEGSDCKTEIREKIIGTYKVVESCDSTGNANYTVTISKASDVQQVLVSPFGGYTGYTATVKDDKGTLSLVSTTPSTGHTFSNLTGTVSSDAKTITATYKTSATNGTENCTGTWTRQ